MAIKKVENRVPVIYDNDMNTVHFDTLTAKQMDIFFALCYKLQDQGGRQVQISFNEVKKLSDWDMTQSNEKFVAMVNDMVDKVMKLQITRRETAHTKQYTDRFTIFPTSRVDLETKTITLRVNNDLVTLFNLMFESFTTFMLEDLNSISTTYGKELFRQLKQFRMQGKRYLTIEELQDCLSLPKSYVKHKAEIKRRVLTTKTCSQLRKVLPGFRYRTTRNKRKNNAITGFWFFWTPEHRYEDNDKANKRFRKEYGLDD
jgi:plasmid replication initiation protein